ncbi:MAG: tRNA (N6-threonylcarbamoyladenosine(37)-N6)-methyltransferase TrmO, partial [Clostridia bacterium]|nr:tRNA (N6-threonylcarbamoyladenosine(37)-N6)-methyltransferase TrmO [Clostridia bacterium]
MKIIAHIHTDFPEKFGLPRQSGLVEGLKGKIVFEPEYRVPEALRGIEGFSHLWLIWQFSEAVRPTWSPTVRPPRLGGNKRMGVFATRSPFRPNPIGLSCVKLEGWEMTDEGPVITVSGIDIMDGTPIYDIKPYLPHADCKADATGGFSTDAMHHSLEVVIPAELEAKIEERLRKPLAELL